eukprot:364735-Chlamydomonas_euryale.AAC.5
MGKGGNEREEEGERESEGAQWSATAACNALRLRRMKAAKACESRSLKDKARLGASSSLVANQLQRRNQQERPNRFLAK